MLLGPVDRVGEAREEDHDRVWVRLENLLDELLIFERDRLSIDRFFSIAGQDRLGPAGVAGWVVADADDRDVTLLRKPGRSRVGIVARVAYANVRSDGRGNAAQRRHLIRRRAAVPIEQHLVRPWPDDGDRFDSRPIERQHAQFVFQEYDRLLRCPPRQRPMFIRAPRLDLSTRADRRVRHARRRIEQAKLDHHAEVSAQRLIDLRFVDQTFVDGLAHRISMLVEELRDAACTLHAAACASVA